MAVETIVAIATELEDESKGNPDDYRWKAAALLLRQDELLKQALEALEAALSDDKPYIVQSKKAITAIRALKGKQ